ncbi:unnamed protein product [Cyprideis torosa]|uniref:Uncharacterized protein n=1 Tax=Cyprideis torosa TaxID=163714 RepID=A0A7R8ZQ10_9CRUS|nr:unnamed protein product [Cyprideis torosa]CAG0889556.1 unnamed protein product [Cyprideis torosa]
MAGAENGKGNYLFIQQRAKPPTRNAPSSARKANSPRVRGTFATMPAVALLASCGVIACSAAALYKVNKAMAMEARRKEYCRKMMMAQEQESTGPSASNGGPPNTAPAPNMDNRLTMAVRI